MRYSRCSASRHPLPVKSKKIALNFERNHILLKKLPPSVSMPKVCPAQQGDTAACTLVKRLVSQLLTSHFVWNLEHNFCKYCRAYTTANINWTVDSTQQHPCRCSECNFAERPQLSISGDSLELSAYLARSRLGLISIRCPRVRTATISDPPNCTCTLVLYLMLFIDSFAISSHSWLFPTSSDLPNCTSTPKGHLIPQTISDQLWLFLINSWWLLMINIVVNVHSHCSLLHWLYIWCYWRMVITFTIYL